MNTLTKFLIFTVSVFLALNCQAQFRRTSDGAIYPYTNTLKNSDVFIIGVIGQTNKNIASSNMLSAIGGITTASATSIANSSSLAATNKLNTDLNARVLGATNKLDTDLRATILGATNKLDTDLRSGLQNGSTILSNVVSGASNRYVGSFVGLITTGNVTNGSGSRVAYLSDTNGLGGGGSSTNGDFFSYSLSNSASVGATSIALDRAVLSPAGSAGRVVIGFDTTNAEIRSVSTISGQTVNFNVATLRAHASGDKVRWDNEGEAYPTDIKISPGLGNDSGFEMLKILNEAGNASVIFDGAGQAMSGSVPLVVPNSIRFRNATVNAKSGIVQGNTNAYMFMARQGGRNAFTADATTDVITIPAGWTPPGSPSNATVVFYDMGAGTLPAPLTNGVPYYVVTNSSTAVTVKAHISSSTALDLTTSGSGFMDSEAGSLVKLHLNDVHFNGVAFPNIGGLQANVQQQSGLRDVRISNVDTGLRLAGQQAHFSNLEIGPCTVGIDMRALPGDPNGALFMYIFTLNIEQFTRSAMYLGGSQNHVTGLHIEGGTSTTEPIIDGTFEASHIVIDNWTVGSMNGTNDVFRFGASDGSIKNSYDLRAGTVTAASADNGMLALNDLTRGHKIKIYTTTNDAGGTGTRHIARLLAPPIPDSAAVPSMQGGENWLGQGGALFTGPQQQIYEDFLYARAGTNQYGAIFRAVRSDYTPRSGFGTNGDLIPPLTIAWASATNVLTLSYPYTASSYVMATDAYVTGIMGQMDGLPSSAMFSLTNSASTNCSLRFPASFISYGGQMTNNVLLIPAGKKARVAVAYDDGTNVAGAIQP